MATFAVLEAGVGLAEIMEEGSNTEPLSPKFGEHVAPRKRGKSRRDDRQVEQCFETRSDVSAVVS